MILVIQAKSEQESNGAPVTIVLQVGGVAGVRNGPAALTKAAVFRNLEIAENLGCLGAEGMS